MKQERPPSTRAALNRQRWWLSIPGPLVKSAAGRRRERLQLVLSSQPWTVSLVQHLHDFSLGVIDREAMWQTRHRIIVTQRYFIRFETAVSGGRCAARPQGVHLTFRQRLKRAHNIQVPAQHVNGIHAD